MKTQNMLEGLKQAGIRARAYKSPPVGKDIFAITVASNHPEGTVLVNQGQAQVDIVPDPTRRQAVATVRERGRVVTKRVRGQFEIQTGFTSTNRTHRRVLKSNFPVIMPAGTRWSFSNITARTTVNGNCHVSGNVTAKVVDRTTNHFLIGMDETRNFICLLPRPAKTVAEAHEMLKPKGLQEGWKRQGEWFFIPCSAEKSEKLDKMAIKEYQRIRERRLGNTTHSAKSAIRILEGRKQVVYARGFIVDMRQGHHKALFLNDWHVVRKNKEATLKVGREQAAAARRRTRTWD